MFASPNILVRLHHFKVFMLLHLTISLENVATSYKVVEKVALVWTWSKKFALKCKRSLVADYRHVGKVQRRWLAETKMSRLCMWLGKVKRSVGMMARLVLWLSGWLLLCVWRVRFPYRSNIVWLTVLLRCCYGVAYGVLGLAVCVYELFIGVLWSRKHD